VTFFPRLGPRDLLRDPVYRRLWMSVFSSSFGAQVTLIAIPITAAVLLHASPVQMGLLTAMEILPFVLFSLPGGVWLDGVRKLPVYVVGETLMAAALLSVPLAWWAGWLGMNWLYAIAFAIGSVHTIAGSASQIVLTQIVPRERLVEAHAKNALASSSAEVMGPGIAGALIRMVGAPLALVANALLLGFSALILRGIRVHEEVRPVRIRMLPAMAQGLRFVRDVPLLRTMSICCATWQLCHNAAVVVQILFATRVLGLDAASVGLCYVALGVGTISGSAFGNRISMRLGPGPALVLSFGICSAAWLCGAVAPANAVGVGLFVAMLLLFGFGATLLFVTFIPLRQAVTPPHFLGRMTTTVRWLILIPAVPGALLGGFIGEHIGLRYTLLFSGLTALLLAVLAWRQPILRGTRTLPWPADAPVDEEPPGPESGPGEYIP